MRTPATIFFGLLSVLLATQAVAQPTLLNLDRAAGPARVTVNGEAGSAYSVLASTNDLSSNWDFLATLWLSGGSQSWFDSESMLMPRRFYRALKLGPAAYEAVPDFRLIDQQGVSRRLRYFTDMASVRAIVLIFTGNGCTRVRNLAPTIKAITNQFGPQGVILWLIDSNAGDTRSNILVEATSLGFSNGPPILHDSAQLVARAYNATTAPEVVAINPDPFNGWNIFYRGAIDDRLGTNYAATTQSYLSNALSRFLAGQPVSPSRTHTVGCDLVLNPPLASVSYSTDVAPLLQSKCVRCHSPGNIGSWAMTNYNLVYNKKGSIKAKILTGEMPPWHADSLYSSFTNDTSLKPSEAAMLVQWIDAGAPRGSGPDPLAMTAPPPTNYPYVWPVELGQPTSVLTIPTQTISGSGDEPYHYIDLTTTFATDVWLKAAIIRPDNLSIVHHVLVYNGTNSQLQGMDGFFAGYVPGYDAATFPPGTGKFLPRGAVLTFQIHYIRNGGVNMDRTQIGLYTLPAAPAYSLQTKSAYNFFFSIPPNNPDLQTTATFGPFAKAVYLYEMSPHMHLRGSRFKYEAVYANNSREVLMSVPFYDFSWQTLYRLTVPKLLPAGTRVVCTGAWDNSAQNHSNPDHNVTVTFGQQTDDEMFIGYFNYAEVP